MKEIVLDDNTLLMDTLQLQEEVDKLRSENKVLREAFTEYEKCVSFMGCDCGSCYDKRETGFKIMKNIFCETT